MPTTAEIQAKSSAALDELEQERIREITGESLATLTPLLAGLNSSQNKAMRADIDVWDEIGDTTEKLSGGRSGVDVDSERDRELVRRRVRLRLGLAEVRPATNLEDPEAIGLLTVIGPGWKSGDPASGEH